MKCLKCLKNIDNDSLYCKYCGSKIDDVEKIKQENEHLANIFNGISQSLYKNSKLSKDEFDEEFEAFKHFEERKLTNNDYYKIIVYVVFYSGFKASTVDKCKASIENYFSHYNKVAEYNEKDISVMMSDGQMIKNRRKIEACIYNANVIIDLIGKHGSVMKYIESFSPNNDMGLRKLHKDLIKKFKYISEITSYHILTDIGLNVLKPDRVIMRIFTRLDLVESINDYWEAVIIGRKFSRALNLPIRYIDIILVVYGQLNLNAFTSICAEKNPKCDLCSINSFCNYYKLQNEKHV